MVSPFFNQLIQASPHGRILVHEGTPSHGRASDAHQNVRVSGQVPLHCRMEALEMGHQHSDAKVTEARVLKSSQDSNWLLQKSQELH